MHIIRITCDSLPKVCVDGRPAHRLHSLHLFLSLLVILYYLEKLLKALVSRSFDLHMLDLTRSSNVDLLDEVVNDREGKDHSYEEGHGEHYREDGPRNIQAGNN